MGFSYNHRLAQAAQAKILPAQKDQLTADYAAYVRRVVQEDLTCEECRALMAFYRCRFAELVNMIVLDRMGSRVVRPR